MLLKDLIKTLLLWAIDSGINIAEKVCAKFSEKMSKEEKPVE